jgi:hypothetical protein
MVQNIQDGHTLKPVRMKISKPHLHMHTPEHPFEVLSGADRLTDNAMLIALLSCCVASGIISAMLGIPGVIGLVCIPFLAAGFFLLFSRPAVGLYAAIILGFTLIGFGRYAKGLQVGLMMDAILILTFTAIFLHPFRKKTDWSPVKKDITWLAFIWFGYSLMQLFNPESNSTEAWFSGRGIGLYMMCIIPLTLLFIRTDRHLDRFFLIWGICSLLVTAKGIHQHINGPDQWERAWLEEGNDKTHILFGQLRAFSFLSDAGQFGANQAYSAVVAAIISLAQKKTYMRVFFCCVAILSLYGLMISGTRGALSIPLVGIVAYSILRKKILITGIGILMLAGIIFFFRFTTIGQSDYNIRRMRSAFDRNDPSLQVRLANQRLLKTYMASRPFGGGIGHGGVKARRFLPNAFLSQIPTDSWYVLIWVEQGIVGLILHLFILGYVLLKSSYRIMFRIRDPTLKIKMTALAAGMAGVVVASYGNAVLGQMPTSILIYMSMALLMNTKNLDRSALPHEHFESIKEINTNMPLK